MLTQLYKYMTPLLFDIKNRFNITVVAMCARCERGKLYSIVRGSSWSAHVHFARDSDLLSGGALTNHNSEECNFESFTARWGDRVKLCNWPRWEPRKTRDGNLEPEPGTDKLRYMDTFVWRWPKKLWPNRWSSVGDTLSRKVKRLDLKAEDIELRGF